MGNTIRCNNCGHRNESGRVFCEKCSGDLYRNNYKDNLDSYLISIF